MDQILPTKSSLTSLASLSEFTAQSGRALLELFIEPLSVTSVLMFFPPN